MLATRYEVAITPKGNPACGIRTQTFSKRAAAFDLAREWARAETVRAFDELVEVSVTDRMAHTRGQFRWSFETAALEAMKQTDLDS